MKAIVEIATGEIKRLTGSTVAYEDWPGLFGGSDYLHLDLGAIDPDYVVCQDDGNGSWELVEDTAQKESDHWDAIRASRNSKMADCDEARNYMTWAESGTPWTQQQKDDWRNYRQALLDVPQSIQADIDSSTIDSVLDVDPDTYTWPTKPTLP